MGNLIYSKSPIVAHPYYAAEIGVHLYSAEELSYYIFNNAVLLDESFLDERLFEFIEEAGYPQTVDKIRKWQKTAEFWELLLVILQDIRYYDETELEAFSREIKRIATEGVETISKEKADYMLQMGRLYDAIRIYDKLLSAKTITNKKLVSKVYASKACALARLFDYKDAIVNYYKGYELTGDENCLRNIYMIHLLKPELECHEEYFDGLPAAKITGWKKEYNKAIERARNNKKVLELKMLELEEPRKRRGGFSKAIFGWKAEYKKCQN